MSTASSKIKDKFNKKEAVKQRKQKQNPNFKGWYASTTLTQTSNTFVEPFFPLFARSLGATAGEIGLLSGIFSLINLSQLLWAELINKIGKSSFIAFIGQLISAILFIPFVFLQVGQIFFLMVIRFFQGLFVSATIPSQANLMADYISEKDRGRKITRFTRLGMIGGFFGTLTGGIIFTFILAENYLSQEDAFKFIFVITGILGILSSIIFRLSVSDKKGIEEIDYLNFINRESFHSSSKLGKFAKISAYMKKFKNFWFFVIFAFVFYFAVYIASPFFIVLEIEFYNFSFFEAALITSVSLVMQIVVATLIEKFDILNVIGRKSMLYLGIIIIFSVSILVIVPNFIVNIPIFLWCFGTFILMGMGWGIFNTTMAVLLLDMVHPKFRTLLIALFNTFIGFAMFFGPILGGLLIDYIYITDSKLAIASAFILRSIMLLFAFLLLIFVKEPQISGIIFKPIRNFFPQLFRINASRGPEVVLSYGRSQKVKERHWYSNGLSRFKKKNK